VAPRVIVTRPEREARRWAELLAQAGVRSLLLPLIEIRAARDREAVAQAWARLPACVSAMFVSGNAVEHFFAARPAGSAGFAAAGPRAWAPGPGTRQALLDAGVPQDCIDAPGEDAGQFDSEALWTRVAPHLAPGSRVLIVRGGGEDGAGGGRNWFAEQLRAAACEPQFVVAYERHVPQPDAAALQAARDAAADGSVWLFSSSEAVGHLQALLPGQDWGGARAIATHPRIAQAVRAAGFGQVRETRPGLGDVVASIESFA
jgi:uroporphyrinogen-III synthase